LYPLQIHHLYSPLDAAKLQYNTFRQGFVNRGIGIIRRKHDRHISNIEKMNITKELVYFGSFLKSSSNMASFAAANVALLPIYLFLIQVIGIPPDSIINGSKNLLN
jgi:hypothetical protein